MSKKTVRKKAVTVGIVVGALSLSACAGTTSPSDGVVESISFVTYAGGDAATKWENLAAAYEEATGIEVKIEVVPSDSYNQVVASRIEAGKAPDVIEVQGGSLVDFVDGGLLTDLSGQPWVDKQIAAVDGVNAMTGGKPYVLTPTIDTQGVFYNVDMFEEHGIEVPDDWDGFLAAVDGFREAGITPLAVGGKDDWTLKVQSIQMSAALQDETDEYSQLVDGSLAYSDSTWRDVLEAWTVLVEHEAYDPQVLGIDWPSSANQFAAGDAAMLIQGSFALPAVREANKNINISVFPLPTPGVDELKVVGSVGSLLGVPTGASHNEAALGFLTFLTEKPNLDKFLTDASAFSAIEGGVGVVDDSLAPFTPLVSEGQVYTISLAPPENVNVVHAAGLQGILAGTTNVDEILAGMDRVQQGK